MCKMTSPNIIDLVQKDWFESWQDPDDTDFVWLTFHNKGIVVSFTRKHFDILVKRCLAKNKYSSFEFYSLELFGFLSLKIISS